MAIRDCIQLIKSAEALNNRILHSKFIQAQTYFAYSNSYREGGHNDTGQIYINKSIEIFKQLPVADNLGYAYDCLPIGILTVEFIPQRVYKKDVISLI